MFTHPLLRTTALDLAPAELVAAVAGELLDRLDVPGVDGRAGTLVRLSMRPSEPAIERHRQLVRLAYDEAIAHGSWSAAGDLAEQLVASAADLPDRAHWMDRLGKARFNELDRDEATDRLIEAAELYAQLRGGRVRRGGCRCTATVERECLLLAMRTDFTRSGRRRHAELDAADHRTGRRRVDRSSLAGAGGGNPRRGLVRVARARSSRGS